MEWECLNTSNIRGTIERDNDIRMFKKDILRFRNHNLPREKI